MRSTLLLCGATLLGIPEVSGLDRSSMYSDPELSRWQRTYEENVRWNFENPLVAAASASHRNVLKEARLRFPLRATGIAEGDPFAFYTNPRTKEIFCPIMSLKFLDDMCLSAAYYSVRDLDQGLLSDYVLMLKYRQESDFPDNRFPSPLKALGVPADADADPAVKRTWSALLKSASFWILTHEAGHLVVRGRASASAADASQSAELAADRFAIETMARPPIRVPPLGAVPLLTWMAWWSPNPADFRDEAEYEAFVDKHATHPISSKRLLAFSECIRERSGSFVDENLTDAEVAKRVVAAADEIEGVARTVLSDGGVFKFAFVRGMAVDTKNIGKRVDTVGKGVKGSAPYEGIYRGVFVRQLASGRREWLSVIVGLERTGNEVVGTFDFGVGTGKLSGRVDGESLSLESTWAGCVGKGVLQCEEGGRVLGEWTLNVKSPLGELWYLRRQPSE